MKVPITLIILLIIGVGAFVYYEDAIFPNSTAPEEEYTETIDEEEDIEMCIQVITPARNPETDEIKEFPTPCEVPDGWEVIKPEGLDLQMI